MRLSKCAKLPYCLSHQMGMESRERMRGLPCDKFIMAHRGIARREELDRLIDDNQALALRRAGEILALIPKAMTMSEINQAVCAYYKLLTGKPRPGRSGHGNRRHRHHRVPSCISSAKKRPKGGAFFLLS